MARPRRIAGFLIVAIALWLAVALILGVAGEARTRGRIAERLGESLQAEATIARGDLALLRGSLDLEELAVRRDDLVGHLAITIARMHCELPPLGLALFDRDCRELAVTGTRLALSTAALFRLERPRRPPTRAGRVVIDDARLELSPSALVPGLGRVTVEVVHAEAGATTFKTPLSWLFALEVLRAKVALPGDATLELTYERGELRVAGGLFGATPISLPVAIPVADLAEDPRAEIARLVELGRDIAGRLAARKAGDWLRSKLSSP